MGYCFSSSDRVFQIVGNVSKGVVFELLESGVAAAYLRQSDAYRFLCEDSVASPTGLEASLL